MREPNEVAISAGLLEQLLSEGTARTFTVKPGPPREASIRGVRYDPLMGAIVLIYDRPVEEPVMTVARE